MARSATDILIELVFENAHASDCVLERVEVSVEGHLELIGSDPAYHQQHLLVEADRDNRIEVLGRQLYRDRMILFHGAGPMTRAMLEVALDLVDWRRAAEIFWNDAMLAKLSNL